MSATDTRSGKSLRMGPQTHDFMGADRAAAEAARDSYFASNPANLAVYDSNSDLLVRLIYTDVELTSSFMQRIAGQWVDITPVVQGPNGEVVSLAGVPIGEIPYKLLDGTFGGSGMRVLEDGTILAPPGFGVESGSVTFGDVLKLSEVAGFLGISNLLNERQYTIVDYWTPRDAASSEPTVFHLIEPEFEFISQPVDTTNLPDNPLIYNYTVINNARTNAIKFRTYAAMTNVRIQISQVSNGAVLKYLPNKTAWEKETDGLTWVLGDNTFDFTDSPVILSSGNVLRFEIRADSVALKGNALGAPYFTATLQRGVFDNVITDRVYTASDIKTKLETLVSPNKLSKSAIQDVVNTVNGSFGDVVITAASLSAQPLDATLTGLAAIPISAGNMIYATGIDTFSTVASSAFGRSTLVDLSAAAGRATYGLGDVATRNVDVANGIATLDGAGKLTQMPNKADVGLGNVDNTSDVNKPVSTAQQTAINLSISNHNAAVDPHPQYTTPAEASAAAPVQSVNAKTGAVTLVTGDIPEATNLYYTDVRVGSYLTTNGYTVKSVASSGGGSSVYNTNTAGAVTLRSIIGTGGVTATQNANDITLSTPALASGVYTPTLTMVNNLLAVTAFQCQYMRVGSVVTVSGKINMDVNSNGQICRLGITLPVASDFGAEEDLGGTASSMDIQQNSGIKADITNNRAALEFLANSNTTRDWFFTFTYRII